MSDLISLLSRKLGSTDNSMELLRRNRDSIGVTCDWTEPGLVALSLCSLGVPAEEVSSLLSWREFESFSANLFRAAGYRVRENVRLRGPRAQIDLVAQGDSLVLSVDCKHWRKGVSLSVLGGLARAQRRRSETLRQALPESKPIVSVILTLAEQEERFVDGAAIVPLHLLRSFLLTVEEYAAFLVYS